MVRIDKEAQEYYAQLTAFYQQFRRIGNNYNQCVKTIHTIYGEKKSLAFLYKLAEETRKLEEICRQVIELTKRYEKEYLTKRNNVMVPNITSGSSFYGVIAYNKIKVDEGMAKVL